MNGGSAARCVLVPVCCSAILVNVKWLVQGDRALSGSRAGLQTGRLFVLGFVLRKVELVLKLRFFIVAFAQHLASVCRRRVLAAVEGTHAYGMEGTGELLLNLYRRIFVVYHRNALSDCLVGSIVVFKHVLNALRSALTWPALQRKRTEAVPLHVRCRYVFVKVDVVRMLLLLMLLRELFFIVFRHQLCAVYRSLGRRGGIYFKSLTDKRHAFQMVFRVAAGVFVYRYLLLNQFSQVRPVGVLRVRLTRYQSLHHCQVAVVV